MALSLGVIRWDAWWSNDADSPGEVEARTLSHPLNQINAPAHAINVRSDQIKFDITQARMDQEIAWGNAAGVYWAFLMYSTSLNDVPGTLGMRAGLDLYISSAAKGAMKWCMIQQPKQMGIAASYAAQMNDIADLMVRPDYKQVMGTRPILYLFCPGGSLGGTWGTNYASFAPAITYLRNRVISLGGNNPYIVTIHTFGAVAAEALRLGIGADAVSFYIVGVPGKNNEPAVSMRALAESQWTTMLGAAQQVPALLSGWDRRSRDNRPGPWEPNYLPKMGSTGWYQKHTNAEFAAQIASAKAFIAANPAKCGGENVLCYSWNEFTEGAGCICPTRAEVLAGTHTAKLASILAAL